MRLRTQVAFCFVEFASSIDLCVLAQHKRDVFPILLYTHCLWAFLYAQPMTQDSKSLMPILQNFSKRCRLLTLLLVQALLLQSVFPGFARSEEDALIKNVSFKITGQMVEIYYDLIASPERVYVVHVLLKKRFDKSYGYAPVATSGDIGAAVVAGENRKITWRLSDEFPVGLPGEDCFFVVEIEGTSARPGGISSLVWIMGGVAVVGGVLTVVLLSSKSNKGDTNTPGFPNPPGRP